jgi:choline transport protein
MASSRTIWSFARDDGLPFSRALSSVSPTLRVPVLPIILSWAGVTILGLLYIGSTTVYNSTISCCIILQNFAISVVCVQLMLKGRKMNEHRWLNLGAFGWVCNVVTVVWTVWSSVMWLFPITPDPSASEMSKSRSPVDKGTTS